MKTEIRTSSTGEIGVFENAIKSDMWGKVAYMCPIHVTDIFFIYIRRREDRRRDERKERRVCRGGGGLPRMSLSMAFLWRFENDDS